VSCTSTPASTSGRREAGGEFEVELAAGKYLERDTGSAHGVVQRVDASLHRLRRRRIVGAHVRRGRDLRDPVLGRGAQDPEALLERSRAVVDGGQHVRVQIDHLDRRLSRRHRSSRR
jgi:hypothetical protein